MATLAEVAREPPPLAGIGRRPHDPVDDRRDGLEGRRGRQMLDVHPADRVGRETGPEQARRGLAEGVDMDDRHPHRRRPLDEVGGAAFPRRGAAVPHRQDQVGILEDDDADAVIGARGRIVPAGKDHHPLRRRDQPPVFVARRRFGEVLRVFLHRERKGDRKRDARVEGGKGGVAVGAFGQRREEHGARRFRREHLRMGRQRRLGGGLHGREHRGDIGVDLRPGRFGNAVRPVADDADGEGERRADGRLRHDGGKPLRDRGRRRIGTICRRVSAIRRKDGFVEAAVRLDSIRRPA